MTGKFWLLGFALGMNTLEALGADGSVHDDPSAAVALPLVVILLLAKLGGEIAVRLRQPAVLGELIAGVILGNLYLLGIPWFEPMKGDVFIDLLARLGVMLLLFGVGLDSTIVTEPGTML